MSKSISQSNERKVGVILSYMQIALSSVCSLLYTPIMLRLMGQNEYGLYGTVNSFISLLGLLNLGFSSSYIKFYSVYKAKNAQQKINAFNALFTVVFAVIAGLALLIGLFFSFNLKPVFGDGLTAAEYDKARVMMILLTFTTALNFICTVFGCFVSANQRFAFTKGYSLIITVVMFIVNVIALKLGTGAIGLVVVSASFTIIQQLVYAAYSYKKLEFKFDFKNIDKSVFKEVLVFSGLIAINLIVDKINSGIDAVLLARFCGTAVVAVYSVGASLNNHFTGFSLAISGVFTPHVHSLVHSFEQDSKEQREALTAFFVKVGRVQFLLMALLASGVVFFGKPFIRFWAGADFVGAYPITLVLVIPGIIPLTQNVGIEIQRAMNRHHYRSYLYGLTALLNLGISIYLCQIWGGFGSALGTCIACIIANITLMNIVYNKKINIEIKEYWKNIGRQTLGMLPAFAVGTLIMIFVNIDSILKLIIWIAVYSVVYAASVWFLSANAYEKGLVTGILRKLKLLKH